MEFIVKAVGNRVKSLLEQAGGRLIIEALPQYKFFPVNDHSVVEWGEQEIDAALSQTLAKPGKIRVVFPAGTRERIDDFSTPLVRGKYLIKTGTGRHVRHVWELPTGVLLDYVEDEDFTPEEYQASQNGPYIPALCVRETPEMRAKYGSHSWQETFF